MKGRVGIFLLGLATLIYVVVNLLTPAPTNWTLSFSPKEKIPYGLYLTDHLLTAYFPQQPIERTTSPLYESLQTLVAKGVSNTNFILINYRLGLEPAHLKSLKKYIERGNTVFMSSFEWSKPALDSLGIEVQDFRLGDLAKEMDTFRGGSFEMTAFDKQDSLQAFLKHPKLKNRRFSYPSLWISRIFTKFDSTKSQIWGGLDLQKGTIERLAPNFIQVKMGKGALWLHTSPFTFTNYCMVQGDHQDYVAGVFSLLPNQKTYWYVYDPTGGASQSSLRVILAIPVLRWVWYLAWLGAGLFLFSAGRRHVRAMPVIEPPRNTQVAFVRTLGRFYLSRGHHKDLVEKKVLYWLAQTRQKYRIATHPLDEQFVAQYSAKTGKNQAEVAALCRLIEALHQKTSLREQEAVEVCRQIDRLS